MSREVILVIGGNVGDILMPYFDSSGDYTYSFHFDYFDYLTPDNSGIIDKRTGVGANGIEFKHIDLDKSDLTAYGLVHQDGFVYKQDYAMDNNLDGYIKEYDRYLSNLKCNDILTFVRIHC
ncbi:MAG: hypothetical protein EPO08_20960 [Rhodospirillaceae bacterium]|nr:MAG: hypothetical protein EPO08_20960 [Rhodospirillaceae bacterium]